MMAVSRILVCGAAVLLVLAASVSVAGETKDVKGFLETAFQDRIEGIKKGIYCSTLSCEIDVEMATATQTEPKTFVIATTGSLRGSIPGLKGSAKRTLSLIGSYVLNTCIVKDIKAIVDVTENNKGWGASRIEKGFKGLSVPSTYIMSMDDCIKVDQFLESLS